MPSGCSRSRRCCGCPSSTTAPGPLHDASPGEPLAAALHAWIERGRLHGKGGHGETEAVEGEQINAMEFVARVLVQIPAQRRHFVRYHGFYSNVARGKRKKADVSAEPAPTGEGAAMPDGTARAALRRRWAEMIRRVYEVDLRNRAPSSRSAIANPFISHG